MILKFCFEQLQIPKERKSSTLIFAAADSPARRHSFLGPTAATQHESKAASVALCLFDTVAFVRPLPRSGQRYPTVLGNRPVSPMQAGGGGRGRWSILGRGASAKDAGNEDTLLRAARVPHKRVWT